MVEFVRIAAEALVALPWQLVVRCVGLDFEMGGTMKVEVYHDPGLTEGNMIQQADLAKLAERLNDPSILNLEPVRSVYSSPQSKQVLYLPFSSRPRDEKMVWHLEAVVQDIWKSVENMGTVADVADPPYVFTRILESLALLGCWSELNSGRFSTFDITIDRALAERLPDLDWNESADSAADVVIGTGGVR